ncbi:ABC transporter substrate-binding protein [Sediminicoccus sp. BL-A-41-H5]|uniref:ABC transporter substrate-binding protein n=1 Tax=Sediminicoccus sp. BL-A-41-H5 TaxID=3421106 RepID=UPI003D67A6EB
MSIPFRLVENLRTPGYLPFYLGLHGGFWAREGLDVRIITAPATAETPRLLLAGQADAAWGGPMRVMMHHDADPACPLVCFAQAVARDPFMLVGRRPNPGFRFADLVGLRVGVATDVPTPWMTFQDDLRRANVDPATLLRAPDLPMAQNAAAFAAGSMDVVQLFEPYADQLVQSGAGHVWHRFSDRGDIGYTTLVATRAGLAGNRPALIRLVRGLAAAQEALDKASGAELAEALSGFFPDQPREQLERIALAYRAAGLWARTPDLPPSAFVRLKGALLSGGLIARDIPYDAVADAALSSRHPS